MPGGAPRSWLFTHPRKGLLLGKYIGRTDDMMMMLDTMVVYTAFFSELQHNLGRTPQILIDFRGQEKIVISVLWTYCLANTFSGKYGSWQIIWQRQRMLDATVRTLYASWSLWFSHSKSTGADFLLSVLGSDISTKKWLYREPTHHYITSLTEYQESAWSHP